MQIADKIISGKNTPYVIAEIGHNHGGNINLCKNMFRVAKQCGAAAVKLQKRDNKNLFTKAFYNKPYDNENSYGKTYGEHREALEFGLSEYTELKEYAKKIDITFFATAFDISSADFLYNLDMPAFKIASADLLNEPLIKHISQYKKPIILSTGGAAENDIKKTYNYCKELNLDFAMLHCIASYPNKSEQLNLSYIKKMIQAMPDIPIGYSNHHPAVYLNFIAYTFGAQIIEVHFTLNRASKGTDHAFSLEPKALETLCSDLQSIHQAIGHGTKEILPEEKEALQKMGKSIWPARTIAKGEKLTEENIALKTPMYGGLSPDKYMDILNKTAIYNLSTLFPVQEEDICGK